MEILSTIIIVALVILMIVFILKTIKIIPKETKKAYNDVRNSNNQVGQIIRNSESVLNTNYTKIKKYTQMNITKSYLTGCSWLLTNDISKNIIYTFRQNGELLVTTDGNVEKKSYEFITDSNSILITTQNEIEHFDLINFQNDFLLLNKVSTKNNLIFVNFTKYKDSNKEVIYKNAIKILENQNIIEK